MNVEHYRILVKVFMGIMPLFFVIMLAYGHACIRSKRTDQPAFWYAMFYAGVLFTEMLRGILILMGVMAAHPKDVYYWLAQHIPLGGFLYEVGKRHLKKVWNFTFKSH